VLDFVCIAKVAKIHEDFIVIILQLQNFSIIMIYPLMEKFTIRKRDNSTLSRFLPPDFAQTPLDLASLTISKRLPVRNLISCLSEEIRYILKIKIKNQYRPLERTLVVSHFEGSAQNYLPRRLNICYP
jgi:hypothetical protein